MQSSRISRSKKTEENNEPSIGRSKRFEEACELMRKNAAKFLQEDLASESSSEEDLDDSTILEKTLSQYSTVKGDASLEKTREFLQDVITSGAIVCLICIESVKRTDKIWSCHHCFGIFHLHCIQKWAKDSLYNLSDVEKKKKLQWCCPKCRCEYVPSEETFKYLCFCGKVEDPVTDLWTVPHSCGQKCSKKLKPDCGHLCCLLCHPGACPPCPQTVLSSCACGKSKPISQRCSNRQWTCEKKCGKLLFCKLHSCEEMCHEGECPPCRKTCEQKCLCGSETVVRPCEDPLWHCKKICNKLLRCKNHFCEIVCHSGACLDCPSSGPRSCPCGKNIVSLPCTENIVPCGDTCDKLLSCELHRCTQRCHLGPCEKCLQMRVMKCRCGLREKSVPCCKEYVCDIKCKRKRDCGRHFCNKKCCIGNCSPCEVVCGRTLNCGNHKCSSVCHAGPCYPCRETTKVTCNCGSSKIIVPCGRKRAVPPRCSAECKLPADCHHTQRHKHMCHFGSCPPCHLVCGKTLNCGHTCPVYCHSAILTKIDTKEKKLGPWDLLNSYKLELVCKPCPPCLVSVPVTCLGGHEVRNMACYEARPTSCGRPCGRKLFCGNHICKLECHTVSCNPNSLMQSEECEACSEGCSKPRKPGCSHPCLRPCHPGDCLPCKQQLKMKCHCGINVVYSECSSWNDADNEEKSSLLSCSNRCPKQISCGHRCTLLCHAGLCSTIENCKKKITVRCPCKRRKREIQCCNQTKNGNHLECDDECLEQKESIAAVELQLILRKKAEEDKKQEQELQEFLRKTEGKKKKKKKNIDKESNSKLEMFNVIALCTSFVFLLGSLIIYFTLE
ncbi:NF-X1-type zinc finger protein NFXL1-like [Uloborus diversus]|uniref:NF-X1-type zinc finger protein NFXL1-like n=1 Tax=Uloborus diversus TaxID=327109 RepID=UPI00240A22F2|nr:NF-X1-type zinc finger protein NFXL1-like [Uloborus diversus]XP_054708935.1 NF-X1-type zinc finger protein NFXL1-like [Uloborus diversus]